MKRIPRFKKRTWVLAAVVAVIAAMASVGAYAYWTTSGSGAGSATTGTDAGVTVSGDPANGLYPGSNVAVTTVIANSSATQAQQVSNLHVTISIDSTHAGNGCLAADFTYKSDAEASGSDSNPHTTVLNSEIAAGGSLSVPGKVYMADTAVNQDACKGATVNLAYAVNNLP
jgi:hypothetical protein